MLTADSMSPKQVAEIGFAMRKSRHTQPRLPRKSRRFPAEPQALSGKRQAQVSDVYDRKNLVGKLVLAVLNLPPNQIGPNMPRHLVIWFHYRDDAALLYPLEHAVPLGTKLLEEVTV